MKSRSSILTRRGRSRRSLSSSAVTIGAWSNSSDMSAGSKFDRCCQWLSLAGVLAFPLAEAKPRRWRRNWWDALWREAARWTRFRRDGHVGCRNRLLNSCATTGESMADARCYGLRLVGPRKLLPSKELPSKERGICQRRGLALEVGPSSSSVCGHSGHESLQASAHSGTKLNVKVIWLTTSTSPRPDHNIGSEIAD